jgi:uncharacterized membrane protein YkoI
LSNVAGGPKGPLVFWRAALSLTNAAARLQASTMTMNKRYAGTIERTGLAAVGIAAVALLVAGEAAIARPRAALELLQAEPATELAPAQGGVSLGQATSMALSQFPGRVVRAAPIQVGDRMVYEIRILGEDGRTVRTFRIDAQTGSFL